MVKPQHVIALILLAALATGVTATGEAAPPAIPHQFFGNVTISGSPAPVGTVITAMIEDTECGSLMTTDAGRYGDPDWRLGNRLLVTGTAEQNGETIEFFVDEMVAKETAMFKPGGVTCLDLSFEEGGAKPTAGFKANITSGLAPLTVAFTDTSTGAESWSWNFGDGTISTEKNPVHTYTEPGTYTVTLTVTNKDGSSSATVTITVLEEGAVEIIRGSYLTATTTTATIVNWMTQEPVAGTVEYADDAYYTAHGGYENFVTNTTEVEFHHVALEGLTPGTLYHYRVTAGNTTAGDHTFRTFPEDGGFTFVVYGDTQMPANIKLVADRIADEDPLFVLHVGDQVNGVENADEWNDFFSNSGKMLANTTIYTTMGNHEKNHTAYYENFGLPQWYSFTCSDAQFAILDDNEGWTDINLESAWLEEDLDSDAAWKFVVHHHPPYSSTPDRTGGWILLRGYWGEIMRNAGVTAVFNGHVHAYERYLVDGINYIVTGTGSGPLYRLGDEKPEGYQNSLEGTIGYTEVTLYPNGTAVAGFVRVALLSDDDSVIEVYPPGSVFETYTMTRPPRPDLAVVNLTVPDNVTAGTTCTVAGTVKNVGDAASRACSASLIVGDLEINTAAVSALDPDGTAEVSFTWTPMVAGEATLALTVDPDAAIPDINRKNNSLAIAVTVAGSGQGRMPVANFTANTTSGVAPLTIAFTDTSKDAESWSWNFGDGATSTEQNPIHTYTAPGTYTVNLTVTNVAGSDSASGIITVKTPVGSIAVTSVPAGAAIYLDGEGTGDVTNATIAGVPAGEHTVTLALDGYHNTTKSVTVTAGETATLHVNLEKIAVVDPPIAGFKTNMTSGVVQLTIAFIDTSKDAESWSWNFGDGATSTEQNPIHTYTTPGTYTVNLTVTNVAGSDSATQIITVLEIPPQPPAAAENFTLGSDAVNISVGDDGKQQVTINTTAVELDENNNTVNFQAGGLNVTILTEGLTHDEDTVTATVTGVSLASSNPINAPVGTDNVSVSFTAEMNNYNPALGITTSIYEQPGPDVREAFVLAAQDEGSEISSIAYAVYFIKTNLSGDDRIRNATLRLTVSEDWVNANGGVKAIRIFRLGDDGNRSVLETTYEGKEGEMMVFTAISPSGFSAFALGAVTTSVPQTPSPSGSGGGGGGGSRTSVGAASNLKLGDRITLTMQGTAITAVTITANDDLKEVMVTVARGSLPQDASPPEGTVYQYIETTLYRAAASDLSALLIQFTVPTAWLAEQGCTVSQVGLFRYTTEGWKEIPVETLGEENGNAIFSASADAFGLFAITATGEVPDVTEPTVVPTGTVTTRPTDMTTPTAEPTQTPGFGALVTLTSLGAVTLLALRRK